MPRSDDACWWSAQTTADGTWTRTVYVRVLGIALAWICLASTGPRPLFAVDAVVVCPDDHRSALERWLAFRREEGLEISVVSAVADIDTQIRRVRESADGDTRYVVLIGDAPPIGSASDPRLQVPTGYEPTRVTAAWGSTPTLATDLGYGDLNGDGKVDAAVGRLPVSDPDELSHLVTRIIAYERSEDFGLWRGQVQLTGGIGGFGKFADAAIETVARTVITSLLPAETRTRVAYASPGHRFCPAEASFTEAVLNRYQEGARFWVYAGHGWVTELDRVPQGEQGIPVLDGDSVSRLKRQASGAPIALLLACYTGAFDAPTPCLAERMLLADGGPIAIFAGSRVTMPYGNATAAVGLIEGVYDRQELRLGDAWRSMLRQLDHDDQSAEKSPVRMLIDTLAAFCSPSEFSLADERREHMRLYHLLGDPLLRLHHPAPLTLDVETVAIGADGGEAAIVADAAVGAGRGSQPLCVRLTSPIAGTLTVCVDRPLGSVAEGDPNETTVATFSLDVEPGQACESFLSLPSGLTGPVIIRSWVAGASGWATAAKSIMIRERRDRAQD